MFTRPQTHQAPPKDRAFLRAFVHFLLFVGLLAAGWYWRYGREGAGSGETVSIPVPTASNPFASGVYTTPSPAPAPVPIPATPQSRPVEWIKLESTDGRSINAQVLVITDTSVFIRREDGQKFDLPFARLTPDSKQRVLDVRMNRIYGIQK